MLFVDGPTQFVDPRSADYPNYKNREATGSSMTRHNSLLEVTEAVKPPDDSAHF